MHAEVLSLLAAHERAGGFLGEPVGGGEPGGTTGALTPAQRRLIEALGVEPAPPEQVGPYRIVRAIGRGGMGRVFLAEQRGEGFTRPVALKLLAGAAPEAGPRFRSEARILAGLEHPHIARFLDAGRTPEGAAYLAMEYVEGVDLVSHARARALDARARVRLFLDVLEAVRYAHARLVVHCDIKPRNIVVGPDGRARLLDFGIARLLAGDADGYETTGGLAAFTPAYASPEQVRGERATVASDVYSLGVTLYELLAGLHPYHTTLKEGPPVGAMSGRDPEPPSHAARRATPPAGERLALDRDLDAICLKALRCEPAQRYGSADAFADDLRRYLDALPVSARRGGRRYRLGKLLRRQRVPVAAGTVAALALAGGLVAALGQARVAERERDRARDAAAQAQRETRKAERVAQLLAGLFDAASPDSWPGPFTGVELLERGTAGVDHELADEPEVRAELDVTLGLIWRRLGQLDRADALAQRAAQDLEARLGPAHPSVARAWLVLGQVRRGQNRLPEARALLERALAVLRQTLGPDHGRTLGAQAQLGNVVKALGNFAQAESLLRDALGRHDAAGRAESADAAGVAGNLALVLERRERWEEAERLHLRALATMERVYGENSARTLVNLTNLANLWTRKGEHARARAALVKCLSIEQATAGPHYRGSTVVRNLLAYSHRDAGAHRAALREFERAIEDAFRQKGPGAPEAAWPMRGLGLTWQDLGRYDRARAEFLRALELRRAYWKADHWEVAQSVEDLAQLAARTGARAEELRFRREAARVRRAVHSAGHPARARAVGDLGLLLCRSAQAAEGVVLLDEALATPEVGAQDAERYRDARRTCGGAARGSGR